MSYMHRSESEGKSSTESIEDLIDHLVADPELLGQKLGLTALGPATASRILGRRLEKVASGFVA